MATEFGLWRYSMKNLMVLTFLLAMLFLSIVSAEAANRYVRAGATGASNGSDWNNAYTQLPSTLTRGDTYYVADGTYPGYTFDDAISGTALITIKKATVVDHGTATGWLDTYGDGQAVFANEIEINSSYWVIDGNGTHTVPSNNTNNYGFKIASSTSSNYSGIMSLGNTGAVSNITVRYVHIYNTLASYRPGVQNISNGVRSVRLHPSYTHSFIKLQQLFVENSGSDGIQLNRAQNVLLERSYLRRLGQLLPGSPDSHGQALQAFGSQNNLVIRWNVIDACEGQSLLDMGSGSETGIRFYGNVVMIPYGTTDAGGYNISGGIFGDNATTDTISDMRIYNNTFVNLRSSYTFTGTMSTNFTFYNGNNLASVVSHNNIFFNSESSRWAQEQPTAHSFHASGGLGTAGGTNEQTGLTSSIFVNYTSNDFRLASATQAGLTLTAQPWWNSSADTFFGQKDYNTDIYGKVRGADGAWDRGAFEFGGGVVGTDINPPAAPTNVAVQ
jgi:hypothetical protein